MNDLKGSRVFVSGGSGLLGSHVCEALLSEGVGELVVLDNFIRGRRSHLDDVAGQGKLKIIEGSVADSSLISELMNGIDYVAHLAALRVTRCEEEPDACFDVMVKGTHNVIEAAARTKVRKLLYASSVVVYGNPEHEPMDEEHPLNTDNFYGAAKVTGENFCRAWRRSTGLNFVGLRYFNMYGPRMSVEGKDTEVIIKWLEKIESGEPPVIHGDGSATIDWVNVKDAARASMLALKSDVNSEIINVASGKSVSLKELLELLIDLTGSKLNPVFAPARTVYSGAKRVGSTKKAKKCLGFETKINLKEGLAELIAWYRSLKGKG
jgi:UDP-glucose 4-epimerase